MFNRKESTMTTTRQARIQELRNAIIARSIAASYRMNSPDCDVLAIRAHNAINHRTTLLRYPDIAAYWAARHM